jgi:hypothetical protein
LRSWIHTKNQGIRGLQNPKNVSTKPQNKELFEVSTERRASLEAISTRRFALSK